MIRRWLSVLVAAGQELFAEDVGVAAMLGEVAQHVEVDPPERQRPTPVPGQQVVQTQTGDGGPRLLVSQQPEPPALLGGVFDPPVIPVR